VIPCAWWLRRTGVVEGSVDALACSQPAEHVWGLPTPEVLISITSGRGGGTAGGADYSLEASVEDSLLFDMMEMTNKQKAWLVTNGSRQGFAQRVGTYRSRYAVETPLIGVCATPEQPRRAAGGGAAAHDQPGGDKPSRAHNSSTRSIDSQGQSIARPGWLHHVDDELDPNHSHFILASNVPKGGREQSQLRSAFEACVGQSQTWPEMDEYIRRTMEEQSVGWQQADGSDASKPETRMLAMLGKSATDIPVVHVCVQGGREAVSTVLYTVNESLPVLLVRGTGKAADLIADCVCFKFPRGHAKRLDRDRLSSRQAVLFDFLEQIRVQAGHVLPKMDFFSHLDFYRKDQAHPWKTKDLVANPPLDDPSGGGFLAIVQVLKHVSSFPETTQTEIEWRASQVLLAYEIDYGGADNARKVSCVR